MITAIIAAITATQVVTACEVVGAVAGAAVAVAGATETVVSAIKDNK